MSENSNTRLFMVFLAGAATGVAVGYLLNSDKKDALVADLKEGASNLKQGIDDSLGLVKDIVDTLKGKNPGKTSDSQIII